jgi:23S rRNA pseudouridine2605 synthase
MEIRLQKVLAQAGLASRRKAEALIAEGRVEVNGAIVRTLGTKVDPARDLIRVDGALLKEKERKVYYALYKPPEMVTTLSDPEGRATVADCLKGIEERVFVVGRLDWDAEGALIATNDGDLAHRLMHPRFGAQRTYLAKVKGQPDEATLAKLREGVRLEDGVARPESVEVQSPTPKNTWLKLVVTEGRSHLIKRLCAAIGHPVVRLFRPQYAGISVEGMAPGTYRPLTPEEIAALKRAAEGEGERPPSADLRLPARRHRARPQSTDEAARPGGEAWSAGSRYRARPHGTGGAGRPGGEARSAGSRYGAPPQGTGEARSAGSRYGVRPQGTGGAGRPSGEARSAGSRYRAEALEAPGRWSASTRESPTRGFGAPRGKPRPAGRGKGGDGRFSPVREAAPSGEGKRGIGGRSRSPGGLREPRGRFGDKRTRFGGAASERRGGAGRGSAGPGRGPKSFQGSDGRRPKGGPGKGRPRS